MAELRTSSGGAVDVLDYLSQIMGDKRVGGQPAELPGQTDFSAMMDSGEFTLSWPEPEIESPGIIHHAIGSVESALGIVSGAGAFLAGGLAGAAGEASTALSELANMVPIIEKLPDVPRGTGQKWLDKTTELLTHEPLMPGRIGEASRMQLEAVGKIFEIPRKIGDSVGNATMEGALELGFDPETAAMLGASLATFIEAGLFILGPKAVKKAPSIARSSALALRKRVNIAKKTGKWNDPKLAGSIQDVLEQAKKDPAMMADIERYADQFRQQVKTGRVYDRGPAARVRRNDPRPPTAQETLAARRKAGGGEEARRQSRESIGMPITGKGTIISGTGERIPVTIGEGGPRVSRPIPTTNEIVAERMRLRSMGADVPEGGRIGGELGRQLEKGFKSIEDARAFGEIATPDEVKMMRKLRRETLKAAKDSFTQEGELGGELRSAGGQFLKDQADLYMEAIRAATGRKPPGGGPSAPTPAGPTGPTSKLRKGRGTPPDEGIVVAFLDKKGNLLIGEKGETHPQLMNRKGLSANDIAPDGDGFVGPEGKYLNREQALASLPEEFREAAKEFQVGDRFGAKQYQLTELELRKGKRVPKTPETPKETAQRLWKKFKGTKVHQKREALWEKVYKMDETPIDKRDAAFDAKRLEIKAEIDKLGKEEIKLPEQKAWWEAEQKARAAETAVDLNKQKAHDLSSKDKWDEAPQHGTDMRELESILDEGINPGSALDYSPDKMWMEDYPVKISVPSAMRGTHIEHNNYYTMANRARAARVTIDLDHYTSEATPKYEKLIAELKKKHPDVEFDLMIKGNRVRYDGFWEDGKVHQWTWMADNVKQRTSFVTKTTDMADVNARLLEKQKQFGFDPEVPKAEGKKAPPKATFESQAKNHGIEYRGPTGEMVTSKRKVRGKMKDTEVPLEEYFDPDTGERFTVDSAESVGEQLRQHRENVADRTIRYEGVTLEGFARLIDEQLKNNPQEVYKTAEHLQEFVAKKPYRTFEGNADLQVFNDRASELFGIINNELRKKGMEPLRAKAERIRLSEKAKGVTNLKEVRIDKELAALTERFSGKGRPPHIVRLESFIEESRKLLEKDKAEKIPDVDKINKTIKSIESAEQELKAEIAEGREARAAEELKLREEKSIEDSILREDEVEVSLQEGVDISDKLKTQAEKDAYQAYLDMNEEALATSEPMSFAEVMHSAWEVIPTLDPNKVGAGFGAIKGLTHAQTMEWMKLKAQAKRMVGSLEDVFKKMGFSDEQIALAMKIMDEIREVEPQEGMKPKNYKVPPGLDIIKDPIVKARKGAKGTTHIPLHKSYVDAIQFAKELSRAPLRRAFENPIRTFEAAGSRVKELLYDTWREGHHSGIVATKAMEADVKQLFKGVSLVSKKRIGAYGTSLQERGPNILAAQGVEVPRLTPQEMGLYNELRNMYVSTGEAINKMRMQIGKEPIEIRENYMPYIRTFNMTERMGFKQNPVWDKASTLDNTYVNHLATPFRFGIERVKKGAIPIELDAAQMFKTYSNHALRHLHNSTAVALAHELVETRLPRFKKGQLVRNEKGKVVQDWMLKDHKPNLYHSLSAWTNFIAGKDPTTRWMPPLANRALGMLNRNLAAAVLGANFRSFAIQFTALRNTATEIGFRRTAEGIVDTLQDATGASKNRRFAIEHSQVLEGRAYDAAMESTMDAIRGGKVGTFYKGAGRAALWPLKILDMETAIATWNGSYKFATKNLKLKGKKAYSYADDVVTKTQASAAPGDLAPIQRSMIGRTATLFQTFVINDFNFLAKDVLGLKNPRITNDVALKKVIRYVAATAALSYLLEEHMGMQSPFPTPVRDIMEGIEEGDSNFALAKKLAWGLTDPIPVLGSGRYGKSLGGAGVETLDEVFKSLRSDPLSPPIWEPGGKILGVPGVTQTGKSLRARKRGEGIYGQIAGTYRREKKSSSLGSLGGLGGLGRLD